jgi:DNA mismatch repair protein MutL
VSDVIRLLPDSVANQIAAGEVIQRPASVVKELVENAMDAGAGEIVIHVKDAGKTLIQVTDNGCGMTCVDARMAFERHATSKIRDAGDLFAIRTMGFRGEALASIAAIADVELRTKRGEDEAGTYLHISATRVITQEPAGCGNGTTIQVKNLFFNVPARRKFLKSDAYELKNIITEVHRMALPNPEVAFQLYHNNTLLHDLPAAPLRKRISDIFGKSVHQALIPLESKTSLVTLSGYLGLPRFARKTMGEQFFFVNRRYMRHPWFHKAVMQAYEKLIHPDAFPSYFLFLDVSPETIDINVHPTKTEIKFENENALWQILNAAVRESLGKNNVVPSIDFDQEGSIDIPLPPRAGTQVELPWLGGRSDFNPFRNEGKPREVWSRDNDNLRSWETMFTSAGQEEPAVNPDTTGAQAPVQTSAFDGKGMAFGGFRVLQIKKKYLVVPVKSGMMIIDQRRAQERILYERFLEILQTDQVASQQILFPHTFELHAADATLLREVLPDMLALGFDIREFGRDTFIINGVPGILEAASPVDIVTRLLEEFKSSPLDARTRVREQVAVSLARASSMSYGEELQPDEMDQLAGQLLACASPNYTADGRKVITIIPVEEMEKLFGK